MSNKIVALLAIPLVALAWYAGYRTGKEGPGGASGGADGMLPVPNRPGKPVATFDGASISDTELKAQIEEQPPFVRSRYSSLEGKREFLDNLVRFEILAREAQKKGLVRDNDIVRQQKRSLVALYVQKEFEEPQQKQQIPDDELHKYYDAHVADYQRPERVRVAHVLFEAPEGDAARRKSQKAAAEAALADLRAREGKDYGAFAELAKKASDDAASKASGGDLQFLSKEALTERVGAPLAELAFNTKEVGKVLDHVVESPKGFHLVKMLGRENALDLKFEGVRESIRSRLIYERRSDAYKAFLEQIKQRAGLTVDTAALEAIKIEAVAPGATIPPQPQQRMGPMMPPVPGARKP